MRSTRASWGTALLAVLDMIDPYPDPDHEPSVECRASGWVRARRTEVVIGRTEVPLVNSANALVHIAT